MVNCQNGGIDPVYSRAAYLCAAEAGNAVQEWCSGPSRSGLQTGAQQLFTAKRP